MALEPVYLIKQLVYLSLVGIALTGSRAPAQGGARLDSYGDPLPADAMARLGTLRLRHPFDVDVIAVSGDNALAASAGGHFLRVWKLATGEDVPQFKGKIRACRAAFFTADCKKLLILQRGELQEWDVLSGDIVRTIPVAASRGYYSQHCLSPCGKWLGVYGLGGGKDKQRLDVIDLAGGSVVFSKEGGFFSFEFSSDGQTIILGTGGYVQQLPLPKHAFMVFELPSGKQVRVFNGPAEWTHHIYPAANGWYTTRQGEVGFELVHVPSGRSVVTIPYPFRIQAFCLREHLVAISDHRHICVLDLKTGRLVRKLLNHRDHFIRAGVFSPDGSLFLTGGRGGTVVCWEVGSGKQMHSFQGHRGHVSSLAFSPDGKLLASGGKHDGYVLVWDVKRAIPMRTFEIDFSTVLSLSFSNDGRILAAGDGYRIETGGAHEAKINVWDITSGKRLGAWRAHLDGAHLLAFSPDDKWLASAGRDCRVRLWDWRTGIRAAQYRLEEESLSLGFPKADRLALLVQNKLRLFRVQPFGELSEASELAKYADWGSRNGKSVVHSPDDTLTLRDVKGESFPLDLWDKTVEAVIYFKKEGFGDFTSFAFSPDSRLLAAGTREGPIELFEVDRLRNRFYWNALGRTVPISPQARRFWGAHPQFLSLLYEAELKGLMEQAFPYSDLIAELADEQFRVREKAMAELRKAGRQALPALQAELTFEPAPETRRRIEELLKQLARSSAVIGKETVAEAPDFARAFAFIQALGQVRTAEGDNILNRLAAAKTDSAFRRAARKALQRASSPAQ